jgi:hypothetical protein
MLPAPRGVSPVAASFVASLCQGIHRVPLLTCRLFFLSMTVVLPKKHARTSQDLAVLVIYRRIATTCHIRI